MYEGIQRLLAALDHTLLCWTVEISKNQESVAHRQLELYFQQMLETAISKAWYNRRMGAPREAIVMLDSMAEMQAKLQTSRNPDTQHLCARYALTKGALQVDAGDYVAAIGTHLDGLRCLLAEQRYRFKNIIIVHVRKLSQKSVHKMRRNVSHWAMFVVIACAHSAVQPRTLLHPRWKASRSPR